MTTSTLYWHCATYAPSAGNAFRPPHEHQLIATAGIEVRGEPDEAGLGLTADVWAIVSPDPTKPLVRTLKCMQNVYNFVTLYGDHFGLPVLWSTALKHGVPMLGFDDDGFPGRIDLAKEIGRLVAPSNGLTFDNIIDLLEMPLRPELDIVSAWESGTPKMQQRIPKRLIVDCCFVALADARLQLARGNITPEYADNFTRVVLEAAAEKVPMVNKVFTSFLGSEPEPAGAVPSEPTKHEPLRPDETDSMAESSGNVDDEFEDLDEQDQGDLEDEQESGDLLDEFDDFGDVGDDDF